MKKNIVITVLIVVVLGLSAYLICSEISNEKSANNENINSNNNSTGEKENSYVIFSNNMQKNRKTIFNLYNGLIMVLDKDGNVYYTISHEKTIGKSIGEKGKYIIDGYNDIYYAEDPSMNNVLDGYKIPISNVLAIYYGTRGNSGTKDFILLKADGKIARLTFSDSYDDIINIENFEETVSNFSNIISVETSDSIGSHSYKLIDIYGNVYDVE